MDIFNARLAEVINSGEYFVGFNETLKAMRKGMAKLVIIADDTNVGMKAEIEKKAKSKKVEVLVFSGSMQELGGACGKSFTVSCMTITDPMAAGVICSLVDGC
ncbi:blast:60S ribosomal protein L30 [Drosophila guanche]|uniref:Large ribosomal subunit protein eL30 n=1 Tax=Drosophila guanche TaxID=7266 RepID=A0A3B0KJS5_DROGU|nr:blast:60S ribosomal protein L30 [Drosophila guanche]